jgi:hypothetical protein
MKVAPLDSEIAADFLVVEHMRLLGGVAHLFDRDRRASVELRGSYACWQLEKLLCCPMMSAESPSLPYGDTSQPAARRDDLQRRALPRCKGPREACRAPSDHGGPFAAPIIAKEISRGRSITD